MFTFGAPARDLNPRCMHAGNRLVYKVKDLPDDPVFTMPRIARGQIQRLGKVEEALICEVEDKFKRSRE